VYFVVVERAGAVCFVEIIVVVVVEPVGCSCDWLMLLVVIIGFCCYWLLLLLLLLLLLVVVVVVVVVVIGLPCGASCVDVVKLVVCCIIY
jgi:hypothetical protein